MRISRSSQTTRLFTLNKEAFMGTPPSRSTIRSPVYQCHIFSYSSRRGCPTAQARSDAVGLFRRGNTRLYRPTKMRLQGYPRRIQRRQSGVALAISVAEAGDTLNWSGSRDSHPDRLLHRERCCYYTTILRAEH